MHSPWLWMCYWIVIVNDRLKCQLSGGTLQGPGNPINPIKRHLCCVIDQKPHIRYNWCPWPGLKNWQNGQGFRVDQFLRWARSRSENWRNEQRGSDMKKNRSAGMRSWWQKWHQGEEPFTNTAVPRFDGGGCWQQHLLIVQAIVKSNGWSEGTAALQLFVHLDGEALNETSCANIGRHRLMELDWVHRYRVYKDPFAHPALRGGGECFLVCCHLWFGLWPSPSLHSSTFPSLRRGRRRARWQQNILQGLTSPRRVSFASSVPVLGDPPPPVHSPDISAQESLRSAVVEEDDMDTGGGTTDTSAPIIPPPPGFGQLSWPHEDWKVGGDPSLITFTEEIPGWFPWSSGGLPVDMPSLPLSPIVLDSLDDSVTANMGSSREESNIPSEVVMIVPPVGDVLPELMDAEILADSPLPTAEGLLADLLWAPVATQPQSVTRHGAVARIVEVRPHNRKGIPVLALRLWGFTSTIRTQCGMSAAETGSQITLFLTRITFTAFPCFWSIFFISRNNVLSHLPGSISCRLADSGTPIHSRKRGWFRGTPNSPDGEA